VGKPQESLTYLLQKVAKHLLLALETELQGLGLSARQYLLLAMVGVDDGLSQQDLAGKLSLDPTVLVKLVDQLEDRGLLKRARFADDRRQHRLTLTVEGKSVLTQAKVVHQRVEREFTRGIGAQRAELRALLSVLALPSPDAEE
jgi:DNA-binding MarR family transcriptional regulator